MESPKGGGTPGTPKVRWSLGSRDDEACRCLAVWVESSEGVPITGVERRLVDRSPTRAEIRSVAIEAIRCQGVSATKLRVEWSRSARVAALLVLLGVTVAGTWSARLVGGDARLSAAATPAAAVNPDDVTGWTDDEVKTWMLSPRGHLTPAVAAMFDRAARLRMREAIPKALQWSKKTRTTNAEEGIQAASAFLAQFTQAEIEAAIEEFSQPHRPAEFMKQDQQRKSSK